MRLFLLGLALAALPAASEPRVTRLAPITVYTHFLQQDPPPAVLEAIQDELAEIMTPSGVELEWRSVTASSGTEASAELAVITFRGGCEATDLTRSAAMPGALGWTHISDGAILPFSEIDCDGIRHFLQLELLHLRQQERDAVFGRAVGRVLAHELYHIFANTRAHGSEGVAKRSYTVRELISPAFHFEEHESDALREGTARARMETPDMAGQ
jgi:hypothetical protein